MKKTLLNFLFIVLALIPILLKPDKASAQEDNAALVEQILQQSSIQVTIQGIPQQLAQLPQMFPISEDDKGAFIDDFMAELASNYNEADALNAIRDYFIEHGHKAKLQEVKNWLASPMGKRVTQAELLSQQQIDLVKLQHFMQKYQPKEGNERHQQYVRLVNALDLSNKIFALLENLAPKMFKVFAQHSSKEAELEEGKSDAASAAFLEQLGDMKKEFETAVGPQMAIGMAYQYQDLSDEELAAFAIFAETEAGQHFYDLSLLSSTDYSTEWVLNILPSLTEKLEAVSK